MEELPALVNGALTAILVAERYLPVKSLPGISLMVRSAQGGTRMNLAVPAQVYDFPAEDIDFITGELRSMLEGGRYLTGRSGSARNEKAFSRQHGDLMASAVNSGTAALEAILTSVASEVVR
ncbi:DegT/DnrJ/EryC1/StrS family aminotransferase [Salinispora arenicola]|uniref:DegT/DnrJ/EryC1/StrS family aminotransferase n=1 Tax=Salinispora arenicola TaxID=168697 RepID=UPI0027DC8C6C|nr:DegT/DnrJ/EryC1/StrS family aminotransferase [Salinispora arenicola]